MKKQVHQVHQEQPDPQDQIEGQSNRGLFARISDSARSRDIDRIAVNSALIVGIFVSVLLLSSQSAASFLTYVLCVVMLTQYTQWSDVRGCSLFWPVLALLVYLPLTSFWSETFSWGEFGSHVGRAVLTLSFVIAFAESQLRGTLQNWLYDALINTGAVVGLLCLVWFFLEPPSDGRLIGMGQLDTAVIAGLVFGFVLLIAVHQFFLSSQARRIVLGFAILLLASVILATGSRGALLATVIGVVVLCCSHALADARRLMICLGGFACVGFAGAAYAWLDPDIHEFLFPRGDSFRFFIWQESIDRLQTSPWFGLGILSDDSVSNGQFRFDHPHNLYLAVALQGGLLGLMLFMWLLIGVIRELLRNLHQVDARLALGILFLALPAYFFDGHELLDKVGDTWLLVWLPVAIGLGLRWHRSY